MKIMGGSQAHLSQNLISKGRFEMTVRMMPVHPWFGDASFEEIICLAVLIASKALPYNATNE